MKPDKQLLKEWNKILYNQGHKALKPGSNSMTDGEQKAKSQGDKFRRKRFKKRMIKEDCIRVREEAGGTWAIIDSKGFLLHTGIKSSSEAWRKAERLEPRPIWKTKKTELR